MKTQLARRRSPSSVDKLQKEKDLSAAEPLFILAPPCTFSWTVCAMLGQHPQMYGLPELHLFSAETVEEWLNIGSQESFHMDHGLVRVIAELYFGGQTDHAVARARGWLRRRSHFTSGFVFEVLAERLKPLVLVEKSPSVIFRAEFMRRAISMLPGARFLHLVSHPATYCEAVMEALREVSAQHPVTAEHWLKQLATFPRNAPGETPVKAVPDPQVDPQVSWQVLHKGIADFLETVPDAQKLVVKGEDLLANSDERLLEVLTWLALHTDSKAVDEVRHPERSPFATYGPATASFGSDIFLVPGPMFRPGWVEPRSLQGPLSWRSDGQGFFPEIKYLASQFGYE